MFIELTPSVERGPQLINVATIRNIEPVKGSQVNFRRIHFVGFSTALDVREKYEEVKMILGQASLVLHGVEQSDPAHAARSRESA